MKKKILIECCLDCPYKDYYKTNIGYYAPVCSKTKNDIPHNVSTHSDDKIRILIINHIPDFCPLEDDE